MSNDDKVNDADYRILFLAQSGHLTSAIAILILIFRRLENNESLSPAMTEYLSNAIREIIVGACTKKGLGDANKALLLKPSGKQKRAIKGKEHRDASIAIAVEKERLLYGNCHKEEGGAMSIVAKRHNLSPSTVEGIYYERARSKDDRACLIKLAIQQIENGSD